VPSQEPAEIQGFSFEPTKEEDPPIKIFVKMTAISKIVHRDDKGMVALSPAGKQGARKPLAGMLRHPPMSRTLPNEPCERIGPAVYRNCHSETGPYAERSDRTLTLPSKWYNAIDDQSNSSTIRRAKPDAVLVRARTGLSISTDEWMLEVCGRESAEHGARNWTSMIYSSRAGQRLKCFI
jgi:hypothetical protein